MVKSAIIAAFVLSAVVGIGFMANAQEAIAPVAAIAVKTTDYATALSACSLKWKESEVRKATPKGQGMAAWQTFRAECVKTEGYASRRR